MITEKSGTWGDSTAPAPPPSRPTRFFRKSGNRNINPIIGTLIIINVNDGPTPILASRTPDLRAAGGADCKCGYTSPVAIRGTIRRDLDQTIRLARS